MDGNDDRKLVAFDECIQRIEQRCQQFRRINVFFPMRTDDKVSPFGQAEFFQNPRNVTASGTGARTAAAADRG